VAGADDDAIVREPSDGGIVALRFADDRLTAVETVDRGRDHLAARRLLAAGAGMTRDEAADPACDLKSRAAATVGR
jgi:3-phenylpropionate/trans-cinnamate dioxygenase ferredoxin reductase subunit